jgi:hypothetical protein
MTIPHTGRTGIWSVTVQGPSSAEGAVFALALRGAELVEQRN